MDDFKVQSRLIAVLALGLLCGCAKTEHKFDNPKDPNSDVAGGGGAASDKDPATGASTNTNDSGAPAPDGNSGASDTGTGACLTGACNPPAGSVYDFANSFSVTPSGCTNIAQVRVFDTGSKLLVFLRANCGSRDSVYSFETSYAGENIAPPALITSDCAGTGVTSYDIDRGATGYLMVYECKTGGYSYTTRVVPVAVDGSAGTAAVYESGSSSRAYRIAWNSGANAFGVARAGQFQRFGENGATIGGPISVNGGGYSLTGLFVASSFWFVLNGGSSAFCSKINSSGSLQCNAVYMSGSGVPSGTLASQSRFISWNSGDFNTYTINATDCTGTEDFAGLRPENTISKGFQGLEIDASVSGHLYKTANSLIFAAFDPAGSAIYSENSVTGYSSSLESAEARAIQGKVYVAYDRDGGGYVSYSTQTLPD